MSAPTPRLRPGTWLRRTTDRWELVNVADITTNGRVLLHLLDGTQQHTTIAYMRDRFERADDSA